MGCHGVRVRVLVGPRGNSREKQTARQVVCSGSIAGSQGNSSEPHQTILIFGDHTRTHEKPVHPRGNRGTTRNVGSRSKAQPCSNVLNRLFSIFDGFMTIRDVVYLVVTSVGVRDTHMVTLCCLYSDHTKNLNHLRSSPGLLRFINKPQRVQRNAAQKTHP